MGQKFDGKVGDSEATMVFSVTGPPAGDVHEGMVWSVVHDAPVVSRRTTSGRSPTLERQTRVPSTSAPPGTASRHPGDGNDVLASLAVAKWALDECRQGNGPVLVEAFTYRMDAHTTSDDPTRYRLSDEMEAWKLKDPIERLRVHLVREEIADQDFFDEVSAESDELAARFRDFCFNMPTPPPERIFSEVYAEETPQLAQQREEYLRYLAGFADDAMAGGVR